MAGNKEEDDNPKWQGKVTARINNLRREQVWGILLKEFCNFHKYLPTIDTCYKLEAGGSTSGIVRHCSSTLPASEGGGEPVVKWANEKLTDIDSTNKVLSYQVLENNMGFGFYKSTLRVKDDDDDDDLNKAAAGCMIEWSFIADPVVDGFRCDELISYLEIGVKGVAQNLDESSLSLS